jgi:hypothetical protein
MFPLLDDTDDAVFLKTVLHYIKNNKCDNAMVDAIPLRQIAEMTDSCKKLSLTGLLDVWNSIRARLYKLRELFECIKNNAIRNELIPSSYMLARTTTICIVAQMVFDLLALNGKRVSDKSTIENDVKEYISGKCACFPGFVQVKNDEYLLNRAVTAFELIMKVNLASNKQSKCDKDTLIGFVSELHVYLGVLRDFYKSDRGSELVKLICERQCCMIAASLLQLEVKLASIATTHDGGKLSCLTLLSNSDRYDHFDQYKCHDVGTKCMCLNYVSGKCHELHSRYDTKVKEAEQQTFIALNLYKIENDYRNTGFIHIETLEEPNCVVFVSKPRGDRNLFTVVEIDYSLIKSAYSSDVIHPVGIAKGVIHYIKSTFNFKKNTPVVAYTDALGFCRKFSVQNNCFETITFDKSNGQFQIV